MSTPKNPFEQKEQKEKEFGAAVVDRVLPGSAAEMAGLLPDDIILSIDDQLLQPDNTSLSRIVSPIRKTVEMTILRDGTKRVLSITPEWNESHQRSVAGVMVRGKMFVESHSDTGDALLERKKGKYWDAEGKEICGYSIDVDYPVHGRILDRKQIRQMLLTNTKGEKVDLFKTFNKRDTPVYLSSPSRGGGSHNALLNEIQISSVEEPLYVGFLLHEFQHANQSDDENWNGYASMYGLSEFTMEHEQLWGLNIKHSVAIIRQYFPELFTGAEEEVFVGKINEALQASRHLVAEKKEIDQRMERATAQPLADSATAIRKETFDTDPQWKRRYEQGTLQDLNEWVQQYRNIFLKHGCDTSDFKNISLFDLENLSKLPLRASEDVRISGMRYDKESEKIHFQLTDRRGRQCSWSVRMTTEEFAQYKSSINQINEQLNAKKEEIEKAYQEAAQVEIRPGVSLLAALAYPRGLIERDAERARLVGLRWLKQKKGIDFLGKLSNLTEQDRAFLEFSENEKELARQPAGHAQRIKREAERVRSSITQTTALDTVHAYMEASNASDETFRALARAGINTSVYRRNQNETETEA